MWSKRKYNMRLNEEEFDIQISCNRKNAYDNLHEAIDTVLKNYYSPPVLETVDDNTRLAMKLWEALKEREDEQ